MPTQADRLLVELAVKNHLISAAEGDACLAEQDREPGVGVGQILVRKSLIKERHLQSLLSKVEKVLAERQGSSPTSLPAGSGAAPASPGGAEAGRGSPGGTPQGGPSPLLSSDGAMVLFGQIGIKLGLINQGDLDRALRLQEHLAQQKTPMRVGEILVKAKRLTPEQVHEVLRYQELWIYACTACGRRFNVSVTGSQQPGASLPCGACGAALVPASSSGIAVQGTHVGTGGGPQLAPMAAPGTSGVASSLLSTSGGLSKERHAANPDDPAGLLGVEWKGYRVDKVLGKGGMGAVYKATQASLNRTVALKVMLRQAGQAGPGERERFEREAKLVGALNHPNIVRVFAAEWNDDLCWFTMEFVRGQDFKDTLRSGSFPMRKGAEVVAKVARAMEVAHRKGIVHRDLKPQNVMIQEGDGEPKILDFGLAKNVSAKDMEQLTQMGAFLGTPAYMAPEQAGGDPSKIDARADVYALGAILYEVLTGRPPFVGKKAIQVIKQVLKEDPVPCRQVFAQAPPELEAIAMKALKKDPAERPQSAAELAAAIEAVLAASPAPEAAAPRQDTALPAASSTPSAVDRTAEKTGDSPKKSFFGRLFGSG